MDFGYKLKKENFRNSANAISKLFFGWIIKLTYKATKEGLEISDLCKLQKKDSSEILGDRLEKYWKNELIRAAKNDVKPSFLRATVKTFLFEFMMYGILWFIVNAVCGCLQPVVLARLILVFSKPYNEDTTKEMIIYSVALVTLQTSSVFCYHHAAFGLSAIGMRIRVAASSLVYRKITRLSQNALGQTAAGQVINILSNDVNRFDLALLPLHSLWVMPIQIVILTFVMWSQVGISSLAGICSMAIISLPVQGYLAKLMGDYRLSISRKTDNRVKLMNEVVSGIQVIKMYAWEKPFEKMIKWARDAEIKDITIASYLRAVYSSCMLFLDRLSLFFTIVCYILIGNSISAEKVFSLAQAYNILQLAVAIWYPCAISEGAEALISIKRIQDFLLLEEREQAKIENMKQHGVKLSGVSASWTASGSTLHDINLETSPGILCAIIGPVGAGKSSLLQLILGELAAKSGKIQIGGEISYSSQEPWLFQSTVRNNILFGQPYEQRLYDKIVKVCALEKDFEQLPQGDKTIVGDRGVSLSGGQRARINLARAIYRQADIYMLDDPLSAVDTHVGKHLFEQCICNYLYDKTRILITHQLQYLKKANLIVVINEGKIEAQGTFEELSRSKLDFTKMLVDYDEIKENSEDVETSLTISTASRRFSQSIKSRKISQSSQAEGSFRRKRISQTDNSAPYVKKVSFAKSEISQTDYSEQQLEPVEKIVGDRNSKPFKEYILATKNRCLLLFLIILMILAQVLCAGADFWVAFWTSQEQLRYSNSPPLSSEILKINRLDGQENITLLNYNYNTTLEKDVIRGTIDEMFDDVVVDNKPVKVIKTYYAMYFYSGLIVSAIIVTISRGFLFFKMCMMSSKNLHSLMFNKLLQSPMRFFDTNPSGRILNRFSKDMGAIDEVLPRVIMDVITILLVMCGILVNISISNPGTVIVMVVLGIIFLQFRTWYVASARIIKHLEGITKAPVFSHINSTLNGIITIRASKAEPTLIKDFDGHQDLHTSVWYILISCISAFGLWLDMICLIFVASVTISFDISHSVHAVNGSLVGLALSQALNLTGMLQYAMRQYMECVTQLISVERVLHYTKLDIEGPFDTPTENIPKDKQWPREGMLQFKNMFLKYVDDDPPVLKNLNFEISPGQKIGIVGRTGAGKSSLIAALFRLAPIKGSIFIDGIDTITLGLTELRRKISIIPQEPVLFSATLRYNLDPFDEFDDNQIWKALEYVGLKNSVDSLNFMVTEGGGNFSLGQRQLVCLARAALRNNKILVLDEATANVDPRTDSFIQATIRKRFQDCSVLTIAHRLNTIMDSDKVMVMSFGNMVEFDHPHKLLQIPDGYFHKLVQETGPVMSLQLKDIAMKAYFKLDNENIDVRA